MPTPVGGGGNGAPRLSGLRVLAVDDEKDSLHLLRFVLTRAGAEVVTATSAEAALRALQEDTTPAEDAARHRFDLMVSDIGMPGEDGLSLISRVRALPPEAGGKVLAVALTGHARAEDRMRALSAGFDLQLAKPVDPGELVLVLSRLVERAG